MVRYLEVEDRDWIQPARDADSPSRSAAPSSDSIEADAGGDPALVVARSPC